MKSREEIIMDLAASIEKEKLKTIENIESFNHGRYGKWSDSIKKRDFEKLRITIEGMV